MNEIFTRIGEDLLGRLHGPLTFRLILQPIMAIIYGTLDGLRDARAGGAPYFWALFTDSAHRREMIGSGWHSIAKVFLLAIAIDAAYQIMVFQFFYPGEAIAVAVVLALVPYLILRGAVNRLSSIRARSRQA